MSDQQQRPPGTAVARREEREEDRQRAEQMLTLAKTPEERALAFEAMDRIRQGRLIRKAAEGIAAQSWGKALSAQHRADLARYALETGTDPVRHWQVLGGNLYDRAELWMDLVSSRPDYMGMDPPEHINDDERLPDDERRRRRELRAKYNMPEDVAGCCIVTIYRRMPTGEVRPFIGVNHAGNRRGYSSTKKAKSDIQDPIGEQDPGKTAETRAFRRAAKRAWPIWPFRREVPSEHGMPVEEVGRKALSDEIREENLRAKALRTGNPTLDGVKQMHEVPGTEGMRIKSNEGDRLPPERVMSGYEGDLVIPTVENQKPIPDPYADPRANTVALICPSCGSWDSLETDGGEHETFTPPCSGGCGSQMRPATVAEMNAGGPIDAAPTTEEEASPAATDNPDDEERREREFDQRLARE